MKTQIEHARALTLTPQMEAVAQAEGLLRRILSVTRSRLGEIVIANHPKPPAAKGGRYRQRSAHQGQRLHRHLLGYL